MKEQIIPGYWSICHRAFSTDHTTYVSDIFAAETAEEALKKYNDMVKTHDKYPYMWEKVTIDSVEPVEAFM
jgi:hypothetical protein